MRETDNVIGFIGPEHCLLGLQFLILDNLGKTSVNFTVFPRLCFVTFELP